MIAPDRRAERVFLSRTRMDIARLRLGHGFGDSGADRAIESAAGSLAIAQAPPTTPAPAPANTAWALTLLAGLVRLGAFRRRS
jgi:hypothetical protein